MRTTIYMIDQLASNSMKSGNPNRGFHKIDVAPCIDTSQQNPIRGQGGTAIIQNDDGGGYEMVGLIDMMGGKAGSHISSGAVSPTLTCGRASVNDIHSIFLERK